MSYYQGPLPEYKSQFFVDPLIADQWSLCRHQFVEGWKSSDDDEVRRAHDEANLRQLLDCVTLDYPSDAPREAGKASPFTVLAEDRWLLTSLLLGCAGSFGGLGSVHASPWFLIPVLSVTAVFTCMTIIAWSDWNAER